MSARRRDEPESPSRSARMMSFLYAIIVLIASILISFYAMNQGIYEFLEFDTMELPLINQPIPEIVFQLVLIVALFMILQFLVVLVVGILGGGKKDPYESSDNWR